MEERWELTVDTPIGRKVLNLDLKISGNEALGTINTDANSNVQIVDGKVNGNEVIFSAFLNTPAGATNTTTTIRISDDTAVGTIMTSFGSFGVNGVKQ